MYLFDKIYIYLLFYLFIIIDKMVFNTRYTEAFNNFEDIPNSNLYLKTPLIEQNLNKKRGDMERLIAALA